MASIAEKSISHVLRCIGCDSRIPASEAQSNFRCIHCGELFEVEYPWSGNAPHAGDLWLPTPSALRHLWNERRTSTLAADQSGVWRFRDLLPIVDDEEIVTLREGNTPLYELPRH